MRKLILAAGVAAAVLIPSLAAAETCENQRNNRTGGTVAGAVIGGILGSAVAGKGDRGTGAVIGGVGGAVIGNQLGKPKESCETAYGYYDSNGAWHANSTPRDQAAGYYDRDGRWVNGAPSGYYDSNQRWVPASGGAYDREGHWVPASNGGYYSSDGRWIATAAPVQSGYGQGGYQPTRPNYQGDRWAGAPADARSRITWLDRRIRNGVSDGSLDRQEGRQALRTLSIISRDANRMRRSNGTLRPRDDLTIQNRLNDLSQQIRWDRRN